MADHEGPISQTISLFSPATLPGGVFVLLPGDFVIAAPDRVSQWNDVAGIVHLATQAATGEIRFSGSIAQATAGATQYSLGWVPVEGDIIQAALSTLSQAAVGSVPVIAQIIAPCTQSAEGSVSYIPRAGITKSVRALNKRVVRIYIGSNLVQQFSQGTLFDADGNQLSLELADGTPVMLEVA